MKCACMLVRQGSEQVSNWAGAQPWRKPHPLQNQKLSNPTKSSLHSWAFLHARTHNSWSHDICAAPKFQASSATSTVSCWTVYIIQNLLPPMKTTQWFFKVSLWVKCVSDVESVLFRNFTGIDWTLFIYISITCLRNRWQRTFKITCSQEKTKSFLLLNLVKGVFYLSYIDWCYKILLCYVDHFLPFFPWST